jgi:hypothetical protein
VLTKHVASAPCVHRRAGLSAWLQDQLLASLRGHVGQPAASLLRTRQGPAGIVSAAQLDVRFAAIAASVVAVGGGPAADLARQLQARNKGGFGLPEAAGMLAGVNVGDGSCTWQQSVADRLW